MLHSLLTDDRNPDFIAAERPARFNWLHNVHDDYTIRRFHLTIVWDHPCLKNISAKFNPLQTTALSNQHIPLASMHFLCKPFQNYLYNKITPH